LPNKNDDKHDIIAGLQEDPYQILFLRDFLSSVYEIFWRKKMNALWKIRETPVFLFCNMYIYKAKKKKKKREAWELENEAMLQGYLCNFKALRASDWLVKCSFDRSWNKVGELILAVRFDDFSNARDLKKNKLCDGWCFWG